MPPHHLPMGQSSCIADSLSCLSVLQDMRKDLRHRQEEKPSQLHRPLGLLILHPVSGRWCCWASDWTDCICWCAVRQTQRDTKQGRGRGGG